MKALFVVNARSGVRRRADMAALLKKTCHEEGAGHEVISCAHKEDLDAIIERASAGMFDLVVAVGGDGTVHEVGKRLIGTPLALGIIPTGSGNGFARHLRLPRGATETVRLCSNGLITTIDTAEVNGEPFIGVMGIGLDAEIAHRFSDSSRRGLKTYVREGMRAFMSFKPEHYALVVDGQEAETTAVLIAVANSSQYGNEARIAPLASLQDGLLDVVIIERAALLRMPFLLARLFNGTLDQARGVRFLQGAAVEIRRRTAGPAHLDGEPVTLPETLNVQIRPRSLRVLLPATSTRI